MMHPCDALPGLLELSAWIMKALRPRVCTPETGVSGIAKGPTFEESRGGPTTYSPTGIGPTFGTPCIEWLFFPAPRPEYPRMTNLPL